MALQANLLQFRTFDTGVAPSVALPAGQLAVNITDQKLWVGDGTATPVPLLSGLSDWASDGTDMYNTNTGNVGIGLNTPETQLHVLGTITGQKTDLVGILDLRREASTFDRVITGDSIGRINFQGQDETDAYIVGARINAAATGDFNNDNSANGCELAFNTRVNGGTFSTRMKIAGDNGFVSIGNTPNDAEKELHVFGAPLTAPDSASNRTRMIVENDGNCGILVRSSSTGTGFFEFGDVADANAGAVRYDHSLDQMAFLVSGTPAMYVGRSGTFDVFIGKNTADVSLSGWWWDQSALTQTITAIGNNNAEAFQVNMNNYTSGTFYFARWKNNNSTIGSIRTTNGTSVIYSTTSDYRLKDVSGPIMDPLGVVEQLNPVAFKWKSNGEADYGLIAHEVQEVLPHLVAGKKDGEEFQDMNYTGLVPILVAAVQQLQEQVNELQGN